MLQKYENYFIQTYLFETFEDTTAVISEFKQTRQTTGNKKEYLFNIHQGLCLYVHIKIADIPPVPLSLSQQVMFSFCLKEMRVSLSCRRHVYPLIFENNFVFIDLNGNKQRCKRIHKGSYTFTVDHLPILSFICLFNLLISY